MVDLLGMFRRRPAKRSQPGFARSREDITALGDSIGELLNSPVRDAPPIARETAMAASIDVPRVPAGQPRQPVRPRAPAEQPGQPVRPRPPANKPRSKGNGGGPQLLRRPGFLAVHSVEKSFGTRQV